jgi:hypothetical protein
MLAFSTLSHSFLDYLKIQDKCKDYIHEYTRSTIMKKIVSYLLCKRRVEMECRLLFCGDHVMNKVTVYLPSS